MVPESSYPLELYRPDRTMPATQFKWFILTIWTAIDDAVQWMADNTSPVDPDVLLEYCKGQEELADPDGQLHLQVSR